MFSPEWGKWSGAIHQVLGMLMDEAPPWQYCWHQGSRGTMSYLEILIFFFFFLGHCFIVSCGSFSNWEKVFGFLNFFSLWRTAYLMHSEMVIQLSWYLRMFMAVLISDNQGIMVLSSEPPLRRLIPQMWLSSAKSWIKKCSVEFCP